MSVVEPPILLLVAGMHRSGTSALCAALHACGATFGERLLAPMAGVNADGFWEDADVVAANDALLGAVGASWYSLTQPCAAQGWPDEALAHFQEHARAILQRGFGPGAVRVVKDPRLCLTLPLWLQACASLGIHAQVCAAVRAPLEVAQSLQRRDGFPFAYGLRLDLAYRDALAAALPAGSLQVSYPELIEDAPQVLANLATRLPLQVNAERILSTVKRDLRHHQAPVTVAEADLLERAVIPAAELPALAACIEQRFPTGAMIAELVACFVARGAELTAIGEAHSQALATIAGKDGDINALAAEHGEALATIAERDQQITELDQRLQDTGGWLERALATISERDAQVSTLDGRLAEIGALHSHALEVIAEKDREITEINNLPVLGLAVRAARRYRTQ